MNELIEQTSQLPDTIEDLSKFVIVGREKVKAVKAAISAIEKVGLAQEVHRQKLDEAQELAEVVTDAEVRLGELLKQIPKRSGGINQYNKEENSTSVEKSKSEALADMGITKDQTSDFQRMADHPEAVRKAKEKARQENRVLSRRDVMEQVRFENQLDAIEASDDEALKEQVRSGDVSINQAYRAIKGIEGKSPAQQKKEYVAEAKKGCETYLRKKDEGVVSIADIKSDKENRQIVARDLYHRCMTMGERVKQIDFEQAQGDINLKAMARNIDEADLARLQNEITEIIKSLHRILGKVVRG